MNGWIKLHRKFLDTSIHSNPNCVALVIYCLLKANYEDNKIIWNGREMTVRRGQFVSGRLNMHLATGISIQTLRTCLNILVNTEFLTIKSTNKFSIISICKYNEYQILENETNQQTNKQLTNNQQTTNKQLTTDKKDKKDKKEEGPSTSCRFQKPTSAEVSEYARSIDFVLDGDKFWNFYESKGWVVGKSAMKSWRAAVKTWKSKQEEFDGAPKKEKEVECHL